MSRCPHEPSWAFSSGFQPGKTGVKRSVPFLEFDRKQSAKELAKHESSLQLTRSRLFLRSHPFRPEWKVLLRTGLMRAGALFELPVSESFSVWDPNYCHFLRWCTLDSPGRPLPPLQYLIGTINRSSFRISPALCHAFKYGGNAVWRCAGSAVAFWRAAALWRQEKNSKILGN